MMAGKTILTTSLMPERYAEIEKQTKDNDINWEMAISLCERIVTAYKKGEIKFEESIRYIINLFANPNSEFERKTSAHQIHYIKEITDSTPEKRSRNSKKNRPKFIEDMGLALIKMALNEKFHVKRLGIDEKNSAFKKVQIILANMGINENDTTISSWYSNKPGDKKIIKSKVYTKNRNKSK